jgi:hypothetical protein
MAGTGLQVFTIRSGLFESLRIRLSTLEKDENRSGQPFCEWFLLQREYRGVVRLHNSNVAGISDAGF